MEDPVYADYQEEAPSKMFNPLVYVSYRGGQQRPLCISVHRLLRSPRRRQAIAIQFIAAYGWYIVGVCALVLYLVHKLKPYYKKWQEAREDAFYHKNPDVALARMEAIQRAREKQQQELLAASIRAQEQAKEREEKKRQENLERLEKYGTAGGQRLGHAEDGFLPLSGGASTSTYRPPKRSACKGGGCGR